jgi:hypothetical protein
LLVDYN